MTWEFFTENELRCKCGCGKADMHPEFMHRLVGLRRELGFPFVLSSAFRCPKHNAEVSNTGEEGPHTTGRAVDIQVRGADAVKLVSFAPLYGFKGIGVSQKGGARFIHIDDLGSPFPRPNIWSY